MAKPIHEQLRIAWENSTLTLRQLLTLSGLPLDEGNLSRKLAGLQALRTSEAEALARALRTKITAGR